MSGVWKPLKACRVLAFALLVVIVGAVRPLAAVVLHEIHYHPPEGGTLEFVELFNPTPEDIDLSGWSFGNGVRFEFAPGSVIRAGGYRVVCKDRASLALRFGLALEDLDGEFFGSLSNGGETLALVDASGSIVDEVRFDDDPPWGELADGGGPSLERLCAESPSENPANWIARVGGEPTPLAANGREECPPPPLPAPTIAINEIFYHELEIVEEIEFVELVNTGDAAVNLLGWRFTQGIDFVFASDFVLEPGAFVAVCSNRQAVVEQFGVENAVGDFSGQLSNDGERITLVDAAGALADSVRYRDKGDWPVAADGLGHGLEKIVATAPSDDPASWDVSQVSGGDEWTTIDLFGRATSDRVYVYLAEAGELLLDDFSLRLLDDEGVPGPELLPNGTFDTGLDPWLARGSHETSAWAEGQGPDGSGALHLIATARGSGRTNGVSLETPDPLDRATDLTYHMRFSYRLLSGNDRLTVRLSGASPSRGLYYVRGLGEIASPGAPNGARADSVPPFVDQIGRSPREPTSENAVSVSARVRGEGVDRVTLQVTIFEGESFELEMLDDGLAGDGAAGDGIWGVEVPPQAHDSQVTFRVVASSSTTGVREFPAFNDPTGVYGYYVNDEQPDSNLPVYSLMFPGAVNPRSFVAALNCATYRPASFAYRGDLWFNVGVRRRGQSVCGDGNVIKKFLKVKFLRGREYRGVRKINLQSLYTDKSLIRERMAWENFDSMASPYCFHYYVRLHAEGRYFGLYAAMEHPDHRFLARNDLNPDGNLYKAVASREERDGTTGNVRSSYEKKTNEDGDFSDLEEFLDGLHDARTPDDLVEFFSTNTDEDAIVDYQAAQVLPNNRDYPHKNHYLYHDTERGKWMPITWDMDLTYGKRWDGNNRGVLNDLMDNPGITPWYTTSFRGGGAGNHLLDRFFSRAGAHYRRALIVRLWDALHEKYTSELYEDRIVELRDLLWDEQLRDIAVWGRSAASPNDRNAPAAFDPNLDRVRNHIRIRRDYLLRYLQTTEGFGGHDRLKITEVMYNPVGSSDAEFLELWNNSGGPIDISGWTIEGLGATLGDGTRQEFVFPEGTTVAEDEIFCVVKDPVTFELRNGASIRAIGPYPGNLDNAGEILRVKDVGPGHPATVDLLRYRNDPPWPVRPDGLGYSLELTDVEPDRDNDPATAWRSSEDFGGTPGRIEGITPASSWFSRGDCDADGTPLLTDAVAILDYLFRGAEPPSCLEACDVDASAEINLSDAVFLLNYLFRGAPDPIPAPGPGECGAVDPAACEVSTCAPAE